MQKKDTDKPKTTLWNILNHRVGLLTWSNYELVIMGFMVILITYMYQFVWIKEKKCFSTFPGILYYILTVNCYININCLYSRKVKTRYINTYINIDFFNHWKNKYTDNSKLKFVLWIIVQTHSFSFHKIKKIYYDKDNNKYLSCS